MTTMPDQVILCSVVTEPLLSEFLVLKYSFELYHGPAWLWHIRCDSRSEMVLRSCHNITCHVFCEQAPNRVSPGEQDFNAIASQKMMAMEDAWQAAGCDAVMFLDADIIIAASLLPHVCVHMGDLVLTPNFHPVCVRHHEPFYGYFNSGFVFSRSRNFHSIWRDAFETQGWLLSDQVCLDSVVDQFAMRELDEAANIGFWRSANSSSYEFDPIPQGALFFHVHLFSTSRARSFAMERMFAIHCMNHLARRKENRASALLRFILSQDNTGWYQASRLVGT